MSPPRHLAAAALVALLSIAITPDRVQAEPVSTGRVRAELVAESRSVAPGGSTWIGLRLEMDDGWHVNWRNPGDAGLPPVIDWDLPAGFEAGEIQWPLPERIESGPLVSFGYHGEVLLLAEIRAPADLPTGQPVELAAQADWLVCREACIPEEVRLTLDLRVEAGTPVPDPAWSDLFARARALLPIHGAGWQISASLEDDEVEIEITPPAWWSGDPGVVFFFPFAADLFSHSAAQSFTKRAEGYGLTVARARSNPVTPASVSGLLVSSAGWRGPGSERALEFSAPVQVAGPGGYVAAGITPPARNAHGSLWQPLLFAFLGGLILNLMPCVLPVLSIKVLGLVGQAGASRRAAAGHAAAYTAGVLISFWVLAGLLLGLRAAGAELGWGFQLQSPLFVAILAALFFVLALSLFGVFEVGTRLVGVSGRGQREGLAGTFNGGILAVIVATPCTAPFMGSALGYALTMPAAGALLVFTALGLGLALPYAGLALVPSWLRFVPRPGPWTDAFKQFLGFLLMATVVWLAWVLGGQTGPTGVTVLLLMLLVLALSTWIWGRWGTPAHPPRVRWTSGFLAVLLTAAGLFWGLNSVAASVGRSAVSELESDWKPYSEELVSELRSQGRPVFIDFTADWCLSCKVNERVALEAEPVRRRFAELNVTRLKADWTLRNEQITRALAAFGRSSVPLYVLYPAGSSSEPVILPEIITPSIVLEALSMHDK